MGIIATGQITIVDLNDQVSLSSYISSGSPKVQFISTGGSYTPSWSSTPVILNAEIFKIGGDGTNLITNVNVKNVKWYHKLGTATTWTEITANDGNYELVASSGKNIGIKIKNNVMNKNNPGLAIKCAIAYQEYWMPEPHIQNTEIDYNLSVQGNTGSAGVDAYTVILSNENHSIACNNEGAPLSGELGASGRAKTTVKVYKGSKELTAVGANPSTNQFSVALKGSVAGGGTFTKESNNHTFYLDGSIGDGGSATVTVSCEGSSSTFDKIFTYTKVKSGDSYTAILTNDSHTVPTDEHGNGGNFSNCSTQMKVYRGTKLLSSGLTFTFSKTSGITSTDNTSTGTTSVTAMTVDNGNITITTTINGVTLSKIFSITKQKKGTSAEIYTLVVSSNVINKNKDNSYSPKTITLNSKRSIGNGAISDYAGRFLVEETADNTTWSKKYESTSDESTYTYTPSQNLKSTRVSLYKSGGVTTMLDKQSIVVVTDGYDSKNLTISGNQVFKIDANGSITPSSITLTATKQNVSGEVKWQVIQGNTATDLSTSDTVSITPNTAGWSGNQLTIKCLMVSNANVYDIFTVYKVNDGKGALMGYIYAQHGTVIKNENRSSLPLQGNLFYNGIDKSTDGGTTYKWEKQAANGSWSIIKNTTAGSAGREVTINASDIPNLLNIKCTMVFGGQTYVDTVVLVDQSDPYQISVFSTNGDKFKNGKGITYLSALVLRDGAEHDIINIHPEVPATTGVQEGTIIFCKSDDKYKQLTGAKWVDLQEPPSKKNGKAKFNYTWTRYNQLGQPDVTAFGYGKIIKVTNANVSHLANFWVQVED